MHVWKARCARWIVCGCMFNFQPNVYKEDVFTGSLPQWERSHGRSRERSVSQNGAPTLERCVQRPCLAPDGSSKHGSFAATILFSHHFNFKEEESHLHVGWLECFSGLQLPCTDSLNQTSDVNWFESVKWACIYSNAIIEIRTCAMITGLFRQIFTYAAGNRRCRTRAMHTRIILSSVHKQIYSHNVESFDWDQLLGVCPVSASISIFLSHCSSEADAFVPCYKSRT